MLTDCPLHINHPVGAVEPANGMIAPVGTIPIALPFCCKVVAFKVPLTATFVAERVFVDEFHVNDEDAVKADVPFPTTRPPCVKVVLPVPPLETSVLTASEETAVTRPVLSTVMIGMDLEEPTFVLAARPGTAGRLETGSLPVVSLLASSAVIAVPAWRPDKE